MEIVLSKFVERIKDLIEEQEIGGKKIAQIAEEAEQNLSDLYHWRSEKNRYLPSLADAIKLADYFQCSLSYLLGIEGENSLPKPKGELPAFSVRLAAVVKEKGIPITRIAKEAEFGNTSVIYGWLNGKSLPRLESLLALSRALGCSPDQLLGREE